MPLYHTTKLSKITTTACGSRLSTHAAKATLLDRERSLSASGRKTPSRGQNLPGLPTKWETAFVANPGRTCQTLSSRDSGNSKLLAPPSGTTILTSLARPSTPCFRGLLTQNLASRRRIGNRRDTSYRLARLSNLKRPPAGRPAQPTRGSFGPLWDERTWKIATLVTPRGHSRRFRFYAKRRK